MRFENTDFYGHIWPNHVNKATGTTLELKPGENAEVQEWQDGELVDLPDDFDSAFLKPVKETRSSRTAKPTSDPESTTKEDANG